MFNYTSVISSDLDAIAVDGNDLIIKFKSGGIYRYLNASCEFPKLLSAPSKGKYFHNYIKNNYGKPEKLN